MTQELKYALISVILIVIMLITFVAYCYSNLAQGTTWREIGLCNEIRVSVDWISSIAWIRLVNRLCSSSIEWVMILIKIL